MTSLDEERQARAPVEHALGGQPAPSASALADRLVARERKAKDAAGARAHDAAFDDALARSLEGESAIVKKYDAVASRASELSARADQLLSSVERDFSRSRERDEVSRELSAAKLVMQAAALRTRSLTNDAQVFVKVAAEVQKTPPAHEALPQPAQAAAVRPRKRGPATVRASKPATEATHAAAGESTAKAPAPAKPASPAKAAQPADAPAPAKASDDFNP